MDDVRPDGDKIDFWQDRDEKPNVVIDIDAEDEPHSYANVYAIKIINYNLETVTFYKKAVDSDKDWTPLFNGPVDLGVTGDEILLPGGEQIGMLKIEPQSSTELEPEHFIFSVDIAVCSYGIGKASIPLESNVGFGFSVCSSFHVS